MLGCAKKASPVNLTPASTMFGTGHVRSRSSSPGSLVRPAPALFARAAPSARLVPGQHRPSFHHPTRAGPTRHDAESPRLRFSEAAPVDEPRFGSGRSLAAQLGLPAATRQPNPPNRKRPAAGGPSCSPFRSGSAPLEFLSSRTVLNEYSQVGQRDTKLVRTLPVLRLARRFPFRRHAENFVRPLLSLWLLPEQPKD